MSIIFYRVHERSPLVISFTDLSTIGHETPLVKVKRACVCFLENKTNDSIVYAAPPPIPSQFYITLSISVTIESWSKERSYAGTSFSLVSTSITYVKKKM
jgi:hypothetical protein